MTREEYLSEYAQSNNSHGDVLACKKYISSLEARIAELEKQAVAWHKYPDEKPTESGRYVIHRRHNVMPRIDVRFWTGKDWRDRDDSVYDRDIAYWAYLPEPPDVDNETAH